MTFAIPALAFTGGLALGFILAAFLAVGARDADAILACEEMDRRNAA